MPEQLSLIPFQRFHEAQQRFEYFITGISAALCAYVGQTLQPQKFGFNLYTLEVLSVALVVASIIFGFKHIENGIWLHKLNHTLLQMAERPQGFVDPLSGQVITPTEINTRIATVGKNMKTAQGKIVKYYYWRNRLLLCGFLGLFISKILVPYVK